MKHRRQYILATVVAASALAVVAVCTALLVSSYVQTVRRGPQDKAVLASLEQASIANPEQTPALEAERQRQMQASVDRQKRNRGLSRVLLCAVVLFVIGAKWRLTLVPRKAPDKLTVLTVRGIVPTQPTTHAAPVHREDRPEVNPWAVDRIVREHGRRTESAIPILQAVQNHYRYLPVAVLERVCELTDITPAQAAGLASFYTQFRSTPVGRHLVKICHGTACHVAGAERISDELRRHLGIPLNADSDADLQYTIEPVACMGCCTLAPVAQVDGVTRGHLTADSLIDDVRAAATAKDGSAAQASHRTAGDQNGGQGFEDLPEIRIGLGSCCMAGGSGDVYEAMRRELTAAGVNAHVKRVGCVGMCHNTPLVEAIVPGQSPVLYAGVQAADVRSIVRRHFGRKWPMIGGWRRGERGSAKPLAALAGKAARAIELRDPPVAAFLGPQKHIATEHSGRLDPVCLQDYLRHDGFAALRRVLEGLAPEQVIEEIGSSELRGRGGAGFPTGVKWSKVRAAAGERKYVICNGDEGDPGAFMDRMLMESFPYRIIEGLAIAAFAVGAGEGYFYIRAEYPLAVQRIRDAIAECERQGFLGEHICGTGFALRLHIMEGAGAFVCGEETALIASIEGRRGTPALRPPYPAERGLWGAPTLVNNVETLATVPWIIRNGASRFTSLGTAASKGTKVFALAGKVRRGGLIEVPMGVTVRQIVEEIGGGIKDDPLTGEPRRFKAVQIGGPSGGCIPASLADTPVDYEALTRVGAIMGSGGLVVLDDTDCMVDIARYFLSFTQDQSCGKCTYCRIGTRRMLDVLNKLCEGRGEPADLDRLEELARHVAAGSLCGLGRTAPNPVLTTLRYFRDEYEAHIRGQCPAGRCKALIDYKVLTDRCVGCTICAQHCPADAIEYRPYQPHEVDNTKCTRCDVCRVHCPEHAITVQSPAQTSDAQDTAAAPYREESCRV